MLRRFSKRGGTELREIRFDLGIIEIGPVSASAWRTFSRNQLK